MGHPEPEPQTAAEALAESIGGRLVDQAQAFQTLRVEDVMTPRADIVAVELACTFSGLVERFIEAEHSRMPIFRETLDDPVGVVHVKDVLGIEPSARRSTPLQELLRPVAMVPESRELGDLLVQLQDESGQFAVVLDEYGSTAGIITLEDMVEEIVGDISHEYDVASSEPLVRRWQGAHLLSGRLHPDEVAEACGFHVPEGPYETLAGFVLERLGSIPVVGDGFVESGWSLEVAEMDGRRVSVVRLVAPPPGWLADPAPEDRR